MAKVLLQTDADEAAVLLEEGEDADEDEEDEGCYQSQWQAAADLADHVQQGRKKHVRALAAGSDEIVTERETIVCGSYLCTILALAGIVTVIILVASGQEPNLAWIFITVIPYLIYLAEAFYCSKISAYLTNVCGEDAFLRYVECLQESDPNIRFAIQNYHYETRVHTRTDSNGNTHTEARQERVNTHFAQMFYDIKGHTDETLSPQQFVAMFHLLRGSCNVERSVEGDVSFEIKETGEQVLILLCNFPLDYFPRDIHTGSHHDATRDNFWMQNTVDVHQDKSTEHSLSFPEYVERMMVVLSSTGEDVTTRPWWMHYWVFCLCTLVLMSIPYRWTMYKKTSSMRWAVTKHFSNIHPASWQGDPVHSLKKSQDPHVAQVMQAGHKINIHRQGREEAAQFDGDADEYEEFAFHKRTKVPGFIPLDPPHYWTNKTVNGAFDTKEPVSKEFQEQVQKMLDDTFKHTATRDRKDPLPARLRVKAITRVEDHNMWARYAQKRLEIAAARQTFTQITDLNGSGVVKTMRVMDQAFRDDLVEDMNEFYLFHGSSPAGALGISADGFKLSFVGSNVGTMFGRGAYFAEASSKGDEYAQTDPSGMYSGIYGLLLCRVVCGEMFRITKSNIPVIEKALASGEYDSVLGDREAAADTYREFVVFNEAQIYPEYVILYTRQF